MSNFREPAVAGVFYPDKKEDLQNVISLFLESYTPLENFENIFGIIAPHAGYMYSGKTAAYAYNTIKNKNIKKVIIVSPSHREYFQAISVYPGAGYNTPLGDVKIDKTLRNALIADNKFIKPMINGHKQEHSLEVHLPFLQSVLSDFEIVPLVIGDQKRVYIDALAETLAKFYNEETLIVASTDLSHFHSREKATELDKLVISSVASFNYDKLQLDLETKNCEACGGGGVVALLKAAEIAGFNNASILNYSDSGDVSNDLNEVVGYFSAVIHK